MSRRTKTKRAAAPLDYPTEGERVDRLLGLMVEAIGSNENKEREHFATGVLQTMADDLEALHHAISDDTGHTVDYGLDLDEVPTMLWRLSHRAKAACEVLNMWRGRDAERRHVAAERAELNGAAE